MGDCQVEEAGLSEMGWKAVAADADGMTLTDEMSWGRWWMTEGCEHTCVLCVSTWYGSSRCSILHSPSISQR